jgi:5'(3')-deoxyribonucleotidase
VKKDLYVDFDSTIVNSEQAVCDIYNERYADDPEFVPASGEKVVDWGFLTQCPLIHRDHEDGFAAVAATFGTEAFFEHLTFYPDAREGLECLSRWYNLVICTSATPENASRKVLWIEEHLPFIDEIIILINKNSEGVGKGRVPMMEEGAIFIDDHPENLHSTRAGRKILYKYKETTFNQEWEGERVSSWKELLGKLEVEDCGEVDRSTGA